MNESKRNVIRNLTAIAGLLLYASVGAQVVPTVTLSAGSQAGGFSLEGVVQPVNQTTVSAQANGRLLALKVRAGDFVKSGQLLATIDDREAVVGNERSQAQMLQAQAEFNNIQAQYKRTLELQQKGFVSKAALDTALTQLQAAQATKDQATASIKMSGLTQAYTRVTAPYDGWVLQTHLQAGDLAVAGTPVATVYAPQPLRVVVQMPGSRAGDARGAAQTLIEIDSMAQAPVQIVPTARQIVPSTDAVSQTSEWRWDLGAKDAANLIPGQPVRVLFSGGATVSASGKSLMVPTQAIVRRGELTAVYVAQGKGFVLRAIRTGGQKTAENQEVIAGLRVGDVIALDPVKAAAQR
jgi:RND family efflux transporter MFP subunit